MPGPPRCPACRGDGKCAECFGSGTNIHLNQDEPKCQNCGGSGVCPVCNGSGGPQGEPTGLIDLGL